MKSILTSIVGILSITYSFAQFDTDVDGKTTTNDKVGIGTTTPEGKLHIKNGEILLENSIMYRTNDFSKRPQTSDVGFYSLVPNNWIRFVSDKGRMNFYTNPGSTYRGEGTPDFTIYHDNTTNQKRIGVGINAPIYKLHVSSEEAQTSVAISSNSESKDALLYFGTSNNPKGAQKTAIIAEGQGGWSRAKLHFALNGETGDNSINANAGIEDAKMTIDYDGKVGIGVTNPGEKLEVAGTVKAKLLKIESNSGGEGIVMPNTNNPYLQLMTNQGNPINTFIGNMWGNPYTNPGVVIGSKYGPANNGTGTVLNVTGGATIDPTTGLATDVGESLFIVKNNGKVGIGTTDPQAKLHVNGGALFECSESESIEFKSEIGSIILERDGAFNKINMIGNNNIGETSIAVTDGGEMVITAASIYFNTNFDKTYFRGPSKFEGSVDFTDEFRISNSTGIRFSDNSIQTTASPWSVNTSDQATISKDVLVDGDIICNGVGKKFCFGTTSIPTGYTMAVGGALAATEVYVDEVSDWNDQVFEADYKLKSLDEVKEYITENKHLPEIPSEKEVKEKGFNLAEMDASLLLKIEELTLYVIEQNERIKSLEEQLKKK